MASYRAIMTLNKTKLNMKPNKAKVTVTLTWFLNKL